MKKQKQVTTNRPTSEQWYLDFVRFVQLKGLSLRSRQVYLGWVRRLAEHDPDSSIHRIGKTKVLDFLIHLKDEDKLAPNTLNQAVCSLRTFYRDHLGRDWDIWKKIKRIEPLPHVLTREEVSLLLRTFRDGRYRAYFTVIYQCGLRMSEALAIKPQHIDGKRLIIRVVESKGGKQREVPISPELLARLRRACPKVSRFSGAAELGAFRRLTDVVFCS